MASVLVNLPDYTRLRGGVAAFYVGLRPYWGRAVRYNIVGKRRAGWPGALWLPFDIPKFIIRILCERPKGIVVNPSFNRSAWTRDRIFIRIARLLKTPVVVMFHGWTDSYVDSINSVRLQKQLSGVSRILLLARKFKQQLIEKGVDVPIELFTTHVPDNFLNRSDIKPRNNVARRFLFMSRIEKAKGIYETVGLFRLIKKEYPDSSLVIAGDGTELDAVRHYVASNLIEGVRFAGHVEGMEKEGLLRESDFFLLPSYSEGLPGAMLEAMGYGLPVLTRPVGAIPDFFINDEMGVLVESLDPKDMMQAIRPFLDNEEKQSEASAKNIHFVSENFLSSKVADQLNSLFDDAFREV